MAHRSALELLTRLADDRSRAQEVRLGQATAADQQSEQVLTMLRTRRDYYAAQLRARAATGVNIEVYRNFSCFLTKLDRAIDTQLGTVKDSKILVGQARGSWQSAEIEKQAFSVLDAKARAEQSQRRDRQENKLADDLSTAYWLRCRGDFEITDKGRAFLAQCQQPVTQ